jgi:ribosomal protein S18 acetylase RimI-like enzyme
MGQQIALTQLSRDAFIARSAELMHVYTEAMHPPERQIAGREAIMQRHAANPGFRALAALAPDGRVAGFGYGFHGSPGQWWHDTVAGALATAPARHATPAEHPEPGSPAGMAWLSDSFEVAELHVLPGWQGRGIGRALLTGVTGMLLERTAVLSTHDDETPARRLYRSTGFTDLLTGFRFSDGDQPYAVMGAVLPLRPECGNGARPSAV